MTAWRMLDHDVLRSLVATIRDMSWSWRPDEVPELCRRMGWDLLEEPDHRGACAEAGWDVGGEEIMMTYRDGRVDQIRMDMTEVVREKGPHRDRFVGDAFADAVAIATELLGKPTGWQLSEPPTVRWRMAVSTVLIRNLEVGVLLTWATNRFQDYWDALPTSEELA
jgi:hypothetical protein